MEQDTSKQPTLVTAGGKITCQRCQAMSKRTGKQCGAPADRQSKTGKCKWHGGRSTGPKTEQGRAKCAESKTVHGKDTRKRRKQNAVSMVKLLLLRDLGNRLNLFGPLPNGFPGRRPNSYPDTRLMTTEELVKEIDNLEAKSRSQ
jgi:hypothetical protein